MLRNEGDRLKKVIVCSPENEYFTIDNLALHNINAIADRPRTERQFAALKQLLSGAGAEVLDVPELSGHPNSLFTRDVALCTPEGYVQLRMGLATRRGEEQWMAEILQSAGEPCAGEINEPGTVEGGDVILAGAVAFIGRSQRTNRPGIEQLSRLLGAMDYEVRVAEVAPASLHLGGMMSAIAPERILCCRGAFSRDYFRGFDILEIEPESPSNANVICLDHNEVIANIAENEAAIELLEKSNVKVHALDLSEFRKGAGGPTCLILPVERG